MKIAMNVISQLESNEKFKFFALVAARIFVNSLDIFGAAILGLLVQSVILGSNIPGLMPEWISGLNPLLMIAISFAFFMMKAILSFALYSHTANQSADFEISASEGILRAHILSPEVRQRNSSAEDIRRSSFDSSLMAYGHGPLNLASYISELTLVLLISIFFFFLDPIVTSILGLSVLIFYFILSRVIGRAYENYSRLGLQFNKIARSNLDDITANYRQIATMGKHEFFIENFVKNRAGEARSSASISKISALPRFATESFIVFLIVILVISIHLGLFSSADTAKLSIFAFGFFRVVAALMALQTASGYLKRVEVEGKTAFDAVKLSNPEAEMPKIPKSKSKPHLLLKNLTFSYPGRRKAVLSDLSLEVEFGEVIVISGPSGVGKSTLIDLIFGLKSPDAGQILLFNKPLTAALIRANSFAYVPQETFILQGSLFDNVALGAPITQNNISRVVRILTDLGLENLLLELPEGIHSIIGPKVGGLSGGQKQRLGLARALFSEPRALLLDEATSSLDAISISKVVKVLKGLKGKMTIIIVTHEPDRIGFADNLYTLDDGKLK